MLASTAILRISPGVRNRKLEEETTEEDLV